ncbi:hypothetical protein [uncultured Methanomethylovorans sp.]|uniref:hypothetical protein n=1 Tax=uncultured Methanomethylovorans sp. TaxID=183759 RepID=UPI002AA86157|nr:hypothetical protein [uncultured Methanomethylovorans sp.]
MSNEYNPVAKRLTIEEMKNIVAEEAVPIKGLENEATILTTETGEKASKVFLVAALTEKEDIGKEKSFWKAKVADPSGPIYITAGEYQPEASAQLAEIPIYSIISIIGKLTSFSTEDNIRIINIRAESVNLATAETQKIYLAELEVFLSERLEKNNLSPEIVAKYQPIVKKLLE